MPDYSEDWHPGSFTKNFGWGKDGRGLAELHHAIRVGFGDERGDVRRSVFRKRLDEKGINFYIPANFFLFNYVNETGDWIAFDELVFQAVSFDHTVHFDRLALFTFNLSLVGSWQGARHFQRRPALWSNRYIVERLAQSHGWDVTKVTADDIQVFLDGDERYKAQTSRKLSTNLNFLYQIGGLSAVVADTIERWWMNASFLAADRLCRLRYARRLTISSIGEALDEFDFGPLAGGQNVEKSYALIRLLEMYVSVGGPDRFERSVDAINSGKTNDPRPYGLVDKKLPRAPKSLPAGVVNTMDWLDASYELLDHDELREFDVDMYVREASVRALSKIRERGIKPTMSSADLMTLMRG
ncbi:hypothetical protein FIU97_20540 (plasmid) [Roseivivax sp. THAF40]|uniref:hypothetical protein n=1 Tax=Roseivivax sp. THAF40 TaxID=2587858 RepID=UPI001268AFC3|nr:hypothetical protein [Roseivivax sp. THAF40]QFT48990.1 hypothetical protein FIU97_20540 [Roseivivax sp. THAF40]